MLSIPKVPTENLYKFASVGGLFLAASMAYFAWAGMLAANTRSLDSDTATGLLVERERQLRWAAQDLDVDWKDLSHSEPYFDTPEKKDLARKWHDLMREG